MKLKIYLLIVITFLVNNIPIFNWFEVSFRSKLTKGNSKAKGTMFVSPILKTFLVFITVFLCLTSNAQNYKPFTIRYDNELKGNMLLIGNNILGKDNNALSDNSVNQSTNMQYIDIDSDATTFSSSSANLKMPATTSCFKIAYAGLYWGAILQVPQSRTDINKIKLKLPGNATYTDITGELIYDAVVAPIAAGTNEPTNTPYACYADVTTLVSALANPQGTFTVANVTSSLGSNSSTGLSAGWTLFVVYEDANATTKSITTFDGFSSIYDDKTLSIPISGFTTPPSGVIDIEYAFASLEGDKGETGSKTEINGKAIVTSPARPSNKFFNSAITDINGYFTDRVPNNENTLGYDTGIEKIPAAEKSVINHGATSATITVQVAKGQANPVFSFFSAFAVDVIAPDIALTKTVEDALGNDASNANVTLGQNLYYEINYQNIGNDNVSNFTIKDILPENIIFNYPADIDLTSSGGATVQSYNPLTRTIIFSIPNTSVEISDPQYTIRIKVQVVPTCNELSNACSNEIKNQAFATYRGIVNTTQITDDASFSSTICNFGTAQPTNFLVGITNCTFQRTEVLCGASVVLSASDGYASYSWSTSPTGIPVIGTAQTYTATQTGVYYVRDTASGTCLSIDEQITVVPYGNTITNPVIPFADLLPICPNNGKVLPNIFLCGANATRSINTGISDAASIVWQKLNESSCAAVTVDNCANESSACTWNQVGTGPNYTANTAGQFRVTINYVGGCYSVFYFNVYQNVLNPTVTSQDIICNTLGQITVGGVPGGYEYSLNVAGPYQSSNVFSITTANSYTVYIKQVGVVTNPCVFTVPNILIRKRDFTVSKFVSQPLCNGDKGAIKLAANDVRPQYYFSISQGAALVNSVGPIMASDYEFSGLTPGIYTARVWTDDGCDYSENIEIINPPLLTATSALTKPLTCVAGEITVTPIGGTPPYTYYVNSTTDYQNTPQIAVTNPLPTGGIYTIDVIDSKGCKATTTITVAATPPPVYTVSQTDVKCYNDTTGAINFNVTNANGYTLAFSIDNGTIYTANPTFSNLSAGTYNAIVKYSLAGTDCFSTAQTITITQPSTALTASAGVSELAGCGPSGEGKIRITNPQGGTAPYEYSFDNQATWTTVNEAYKVPGTYTLYIRDTNGCIYAMPNITIDPVPVEPTITVADAVFNCDGTATSTVTVTNNGGANFSYEYLLDGALNTNVPSNVFSNVPSGTHTVSVSYKLLTVPTYSNLLKEDFGSGSDVSSPGINTAFCWEKQDFTTCNNDGKLGNGEYTVTKHLENNPYNGWHNPVDHTSGSATGRYLAVDAGSAIPNNAVLYRKTINDIIPNQPIQVTFYATNLLKVGNTQPNASLTVELQNSSGTPLSSSSTGGIPKTDGWVRYDRTIDPGNNTTLDFVLRLEVAQVNGIDFAVDDIEVYQLPKACVTTKDFTVIIPTDEAFTAAVTGFKNITCAGINNGEITISAQNFDLTKGFQYSIDNGVNWFTQMTSPYTITGLANGTYNVQIRYDATSTGTCVQSFTQILTAPAPLVTTAAVSSLATCTVGATITASSTGGTTAYRYELWNATGTVNVQPSQNTGIFTNVASGTYIVRGYDANNCTNDTAVLTVVTPPAVTATLDPSSDLCFDSVNQASLVVNASGGTSPYVYSLDGAPSQNSNTFNNVGTGTHSIVVTDSFGCIATISNITIAPQLTAAITNIKELDCTASPNAVITGTITGGNAPFVVTVLSGTGPGIIAQPTTNTFTYTTAVASTYQFQIQDAQGCSTTVTATINPLVPVTATLNPVNPGCNGASDGSVQITPSGGVGPYTYSFNGSSFTSTSLYSGLSAGIAYAYEVRDSKNCAFTGTVTLTQPTALVASATATAFSCSATNTKQSATITIAVPTTGTAPYQYSFNGGGYTNTNTLTVNDNGTDQTIPYSVRDANGCTDGGSVTLSKLNPPIAGTIGTTAVTCIVTTSTVTVTPSAGTGVGTLTYEITFPLASATSNTTGVFTGLLPGTYIFKVTDTNGCYYTQSHNVLPVTPIAVSGNVTSDVLCKGGNTGSTTFTVSGFSFSGNYTVTVTTVPATLPYTQNSSGDVITLTNLVAGTYTVEVKDNATGCIANTLVTITEPTAALALTATATNVNCNNDNSQITVAASGGTPNYTYAAVIAGAAAPTTYSNSNVVTVDTNSGTNLLWDVYVKDANGCAIKLDVAISKDDAPTITAPALQCYIGSPLNITIIGAVDPDFTGAEQALTTYSIGGAYQTSPNFTVNAPGIYTLSIKDKNGCIATTTYEVKPQLLLDANMTQDLTCLVNANIVLTASGGTGAYPTYEVSYNSGSYASMAGSPYTTAVAGSYRFKVTDSQGCQAISNVIIVTPKTTPTFTSTPTHVSCFGGNDGSIAVTASLVDGIAPFQYSKDGGTTFQASNVFAGLIAGTYTIVVKDSKGCDSVPVDVVITQPVILTASSSITTPLTCGASNAAQPATVTVTGIDGAGGYQYSFDGGLNYSPTNTYQSYVGITFDVWVKDANGCTYKLVNGVDIPALNPPTDLTFAQPLSTNCTEVKATATNGVLPLTYEITFPVAAAVSNNTGIFPNLAAGTYVFKVTDANGCYYTESFTVTPITITGLKIADVKCFGDNDGAIQYTVSNYVGTYIAVLTSGAGTLVTTGNTINLTGLVAGNYTMQVTDNNTGCIASIPMVVSQPPAGLSITGTTATHVHCNNYNSQITVMASGGSPNYTYAAVIAGAAAPTIYGNSNIITVDTNSGANLSWDVYVKDANGCVTNNTLSPTIVTLDPMPTVTTTPLPTDQCTSNGSSYSFTATGTGVAPLTYSIGGSFQASPTFTVTATGTYTITVKDVNGCTATTNITVYPVLTATAVLTKDLDCSVSPNATVTINAGGGNNTPYTYEVSSDGGLNYSTVGLVGNVFTTNSAGTFLFEVTDANGCKKISNPITINPKVDPEITLLDQIQDIYCNGEATASITVNIDTSKGIGPFTYSIDGTTFQASNVFSGLAAGTYTMTLKDSKGCTDTETIIIGQPNALNYTLTKTDIECTGPPPAINLGSITVDVGSGLGGKAPYTYILTNNVGDPTQTVPNASGTNYTFTGLNYGTYAVSIVDANGCTLKKNIQVTSPPDDLIISVQSTATCAAGGTVSVTAGGALLGNGPFYFAIYQRDAVSGLYPGAPTFTLGVPDAPYVAEDAPGSPYTATFTGLTQGVIYSFIVYDSATGCSYIKQASVATIKATSLATLRVVTDVTCKGAADGTVSITLDKEPTAPVGYVAPLTIDYVVYNSLTNLPIVPANQGFGLAVGAYPYTMPLIGGLSPGSYYVVITEHGGTNDDCKSATLPFDIYESATDLTLTASVVKNDNCSLEAGQIVAIAQGGTTVSREDPLAVPPQVSAPVPYQYQILPDTGTIGDASDDVPPTASDSNWATDNFFEKDSGNYIVYAMDANKCIKSFPITLSLDPSPSITLAVVDQCAVEGAFEIVVNEATAGVAPYSISVNGSAYQNFAFVPGTPNSYTISNLNSGIYNISVHDVNGCIDTESITLYKKVSASSILNKEWTCTTGDANALITTTIFDGQGVFSYKVNINGGGYGLSTNVTGNSFTYSPAPLATATTYQFEITDANGCVVETNVITIEPIENPTATTIVANATCSGTSNGSVTIIPSLGVPPYTYSFNGSGFTSNITYDGLVGTVAGTVYNYQVKDSYDCIFNGTATVFEPTPVTGTIALTQGLTCGAGNATQAATVTVTATLGTGTAPYYYSFDGGLSYSSNNFYTTNVAGNVNAFIKDGNGCVIVAPLTVNVPALNPPTNLNFTSTAVTCLALTSNVTLTTTNGEGTLSYAILFPASATSNVSGASSGIFTGLLPDTYLFQVTDGNGCTYQESYEVKSVIPIAITGVKLSDVKCNGGNTGAIKYTVSGYAGTYTAVLTAGTGTLVQTGNTVDLTGLVADNYTVTVTDNITGCTKSSTITINQPSTVVSIISATATNVHCNNDNSQITVTASGGTPNYTYAVVKSGDPAPVVFAASNILTVDTTSGADLLWDVYVKDLNGCTTMTTATVTPDPMPTVITPALASNQCTVSSGFTFTATGTGIAPLSYSINGGLSYQNSSIFTVNAQGSYTVTIKDGNGCVATSPSPTVVYPQLNVLPEVTKELDCSVSPNAEITVTVTGGRAPFTYRLQIGAGAYSAPASFVSPFTYSAATADTYTFEITDANGCVVTNAISVAPITNPTATETHVDISCNGGNNGSVQIIPAGGSGGYLYSFNGSVFSATSLYTGLSAGIAYPYQVRDSKGCTSAVNTVTLIQPNVLSATSLITTPLSCGSGNAAQPATVTVTGASGTAPYRYSFNGGVSYTSSNTYQSYTGITFDVWVKDANGCLFTLVNGVNIPSLNPPTDLTFNTTSPVTCLADGTVEITGVTGGVGVSQYETIAPSPVVVPKQTTTTFAGLTPGTYLFQVTDANGCTYQESYTVAPVNNITVSGQLISNVTCNPGSNGEVRFTIGNFAGTYTYSINGGIASAPQTNPTITVSGLTSASTQTITVTDETTGCTATTSINVAQSAPLALVANPFVNANCNFGAQVSVTASGGVAPYRHSYVISGAPAGTYTTSASAVLDPAIATAWDVYVRDANGCVITAPLTITIATDPLPSGITVTGLSQCPSATGTYTFTVNVATGMAPFEYSIGAGFQTSPTFTVNAAGAYNVTVKDKNGCTTTVPGLVSILPALQLQAVITALPSCTDGDGALTLSATGGSGTYEYSLDAGTYQSSGNFINIFAGAHTVTVRDITTTCTKSIQVNLGAATPITGFALSKTDVSCNGGSNGVITATIATPASGVNDNPIYTYSIDGGTTTQTSNIFSGLTAGNYTVTVTSARGCVATQAITVVEPAIITVPAPAFTQFGCNAGSNATNFATITVTGVSGGSGVYNYEFIKGGAVVQFGSGNIYTEANLLGGTYTVNVYDSKGCIGTAPATISIVPFIALDKVTVNIDRAITCTNLEDITVTVSSIGGTPASLQYTLVDYNATTGVSGLLYPSQTKATGVFTGLPVANYLITVTNLDTGCSVKSVHYVNEPNTFDLTINSITDVSCFGGTNGSANVTLIDRVITATSPNQAGAFSYTIVDALGNPVTSGTSATAGPLTISALAAGTYTITATLTNSPFCTVSKNFTITQPAAALVIAETHTAITCVSGNNDGSIAAMATGGWPGGYQFELTGPLTVAYSTQSSFTNLTAGTYTVNVRDSKGCVATTTVTLVIPSPITVTASPNTTMLSCLGDKTATITVNLPSGGQGSNYNYTLNTTSLVPATASGPQASPVFSGLGAGTYTITVTDGYSCSATSTPIVITEPTKVSASLVVATTQTCLTQTRLTLSATGGTGTYMYSTNAAFTTVLGSFATSTTFPVPVGTYVYYVRDANGCISNVSNQIKIDPLPALIINLDRTNAVINCAGDNTGVIVATAQGGLGNYSYTLLNGSGAIVQGPTASGNFTALFAGNYQVKVDSGDCTTLSAMISITQPLAPLTATYVTQEVTCNGANNGVFTVNASGGTGIIKYAISPNLNQFLDTNIFDKLAPGNYDVIVQDVLGCYVKINFDITEPAPIVASTIPGTILPEICFGDKDGAFMIEVAGGVLPYSVSLDNPNGTYTTGTPTQTQFDFTGLTGGTHTVYIRDANACGVEWVVVLPESVKINPIAAVDYSCVNNAANNTVTVTVDASITNLADLDYSLDGAPYQISNIFTNVVPGTNHYIDVRHTNGCIQRTADFEILQVDPLTLILSDGGLNEIVATATGGGGGYQYTFNGESNGTKNTFIIYKSGDYTVEVTDANGCVASATRYFEYIDVCVPNYFTPNGDGISDGWAPGCTINYKDLTFDIFDRYGRKIATYRLGEYWNGKYNGQELPSGDYWYVLRLNDPKDNREFVGHFTLYR